VHQYTNSTWTLNSLRLPRPRKRKDATMSWHTCIRLARLRHPQPGLSSKYVLLISFFRPLSNRRYMITASERRLAMLQSTYDQCHSISLRSSNLSSQQCGPHLHPYRSHSRIQKTRRRDQPLRRFRESVPRFTHVGLYTLSTCAADHSRQARNPVVASQSAY
jgi:hypothetical protein